MKKVVIKIRSLIIIIGILILSNPIAGMAINIDEIMTKSEYIYPGRTVKSTITYTFKEKGEPDRIMKMRRFFKNYMGENGVYSKVIFFYDYPPDIKGVSFMVWANAGKPEDKWIYIPFLKEVTKIEKDEGEDFKGSELKTVELVPREPILDKHELIKEDETHYIIESTPKSKDPKYPYSKSIKWIRKDNLTKEKVEYYDYNSNLIKKQMLKWKNINGAWVWDSVSAVNMQNSKEAYMVMDDIIVDEDISDSFFSEEQMKKAQ